MIQGLNQCLTFFKLRKIFPKRQFHIYWHTWFNTLCKYICNTINTICTIFVHLCNVIILTHAVDNQKKDTVYSRQNNYRNKKKNSAAFRSFFPVWPQNLVRCFPWPSSGGIFSWHDISNPGMLQLEYHHTPPQLSVEGASVCVFRSYTFHRHAQKSLIGFRNGEYCRRQMLENPAWNPWKGWHGGGECFDCYTVTYGYISPTLARDLNCPRGQSFSCQAGASTATIFSIMSQVQLLPGLLLKEIHFHNIDELRQCSHNSPRSHPGCIFSQPSRWR